MDFLYKNCKKCGLEKVLNEFYTDKRTKDGYESVSYMLLKETDSWKFETKNPLKVEWVFSLCYI